MGEFDMVIGVLLIGLFLNTYLFGLVTYQFIVYHNTKFNDRPWIKWIVGVLFFIDLVQSCVVVYAGWEMCVTNYNNPAALGVVSWTIPFTACANAVAGFITQIFLGHRVLIMTKNKALVSVIGFLSVFGLFFGFYAGIYSGIIHFHDVASIKDFAKLDPFVIAWLGSQTAADVLITLSLTWTLSRSRTGFRRTDTIINRIIRGAVQTGLFVSIFALADMFSFLFARNTNLYALFAYPLGRIYTNTLLDTLNARTALKNVKGTEVYDDTEDVSFRMQNQTRTIATNGNAHSVHIQKEVIQDFPVVVTVAEDQFDRKYPVEEA